MYNTYSTSKNLLILLIIAVIVVYFLFCSTFLDNNDFMYSAAPIVWSQNGTLYRDVPYVQVPLSIFLNYGIMKLFSIENVFLVSRILSMVLVLAAVLLSAFAMRRTKEKEFILLYILLCLSNAYIVNNGVEMGSYSQPLFLIAVALAVPALGFVPWLGGLLAGVAVGLAAMAKLNFFFVLPAFLLMMLMETKWDRRMIVWFGIGAFAGILPLVYYAALLDFGTLYQRLVRFHYLTLQAHGLDPLKSASQMLTRLSEFALIMAVPAGFLVLRLVDHPFKDRWQTRLLVLVFLGCGIVMAISPRTINPQYLAPLALFILFFCIPDLGTSPERKRVMWVIGLTFFAAQFSSILLQLAQRVLGEKNLAIVETVKMQKQAARIAASLRSCDKRLYTSQPLFLLSKDVKYPAELGAGPFLLALRGGKLRPEDVGVDIDARLKEWAPNLLIYGFYADHNYGNFLEVDAKIQNYVQSHGFETVPLGTVTNRTVVIAYDKACL